MTILQLLLGGGADRFPVDDIALGASHLALDPADASAEIQLTNGGDIRQIEGGSNTDAGDWIAPLINMALYEVRVTPSAGTLSSGNVNVWESLAVTRGWGVSQTILGTKTFSGTLEVRRASDSVVVATTTIDLIADVGT